jgi:hypothetical protein
MNLKELNSIASITSSGSNNSSYYFWRKQKYTTSLSFLSEGSEEVELNSFLFYSADAAGAAGPAILQQETAATPSRAASKDASPSAKEKFEQKREKAQQKREKR